MKKVCSIVTALIMALTIFVVPNLGTAYAEEGQDEGEVMAMKVPATPGNVEVINATTTSITISWDAVDGATGYEIKVGDGNWSDPQTELTYTANRLEPDTPYTIYVGSINDEGPCEEPAQVPARTSKEEITPVYVAPATPANLTATPGYTNIKYTWDSVDADGYAYRRGSDNVDDNQYRANDTSNPITSFDSKGLRQRTYYTFNVRAYIEVPEGTDGGVWINSPDSNAIDNYKFVLLSSDAASITISTNTKERIEAKRYSRGYKYMYYDQNGVYRGDSYAMWNTIKNKKSKTKYLIALDTKRNNLVIYKGSKGKWKVYKHWVCACGQKGHRTPRGNFKIGKRKPKFNTGETEKMGVKRAKFTCWYATKFKGACFFHSTLYYLGSKSKHAAPYVGKHYSHGCVRLEIGNAKWLYKNCKKGTAVISRNYGNDCSYGNRYTYSNYLY